MEYLQLKYRKNEQATHLDSGPERRSHNLRSKSSLRTQQHGRLDIYLEIADMAKKKKSKGENGHISRENILTNAWHNKIFV